VLPNQFGVAARAHAQPDRIAATNEERHKILGDLKSEYENITGQCNFSFSSRKYAYLQQRRRRRVMENRTHTKASFGSRYSKLCN
jgi:hypothetical protein